MPKKNVSKALVKSARSISVKILLENVRALIEEARRDVARSVNSALVMLYWRIGQRIRRDILKEKRAEYGKRIVSALGRQLETEFGRGFSEKSLRRMIQFAEVFPNEQIVASLMRQLSWTHFTLLLPLKALRDKDRLTPDLVFKDPYLLDFLGLKDRYLEKDLEDAILRELEAFLLELGAGFTFMERQKRISVDDEDYYLDLLFFHRGLRRLVAIDLKLGKFKAEYKGQMELYLRWLEEHEQKPGEVSPIGLILCAGKSEEQITLLRLDRGNIRVAAYMTELPSKKLLKQKLHAAIRAARIRLAQKQLKGSKPTKRKKSGSRRKTDRF